MRDRLAPRRRKPKRRCANPLANGNVSLERHLPWRFEETLSISWRVGASARARVGRFGGTGLFGCEEGDAIGGTSLVATGPEALWAITVSAGVSTDRAQKPYATKPRWV